MSIHPAATVRRAYESPLSKRLRRDRRRARFACFAIWLAFTVAMCWAGWTAGGKIGR